MGADDGAASSDDELSGVETDVQDSLTKPEDQELKERLLRKYGNHISTLKLEFSKKKKKEKLPKEARQVLLEWWNAHRKWPYPTVRFDRIAPVYDNVNDLLTFGEHRIWKRMAVSWSGYDPNFLNLVVVLNALLCASNLFPGVGTTSISACCGSGDLAFLLSEKVGPTGKVVALDFSKEQLSIASSRQHSQSKTCYENIKWIECSALDLPFPESSFDAVTIGYGLRNVVDTLEALEEVYRVPKPGSKVSVLDFNNSTNPFITSTQEWMIDYIVVPVAGIYGLANEYRYLKSSINKFLTGKELERLALNAGFSSAKHFEIGGLVGNLVATR